MKDSANVSALPGGNGYSDGSFNYAGYCGYWWSATENGAGDAWDRNMDYGLEGVGRYRNDKSFLYSVRCLQD